MTLSALLDGELEPGVYVWPDAYAVADLEQTAALAGWSLAVVPPVASKAAALAALGTALAFPDHYGQNLDALADCLRDVPPRTLVLWQSWPLLYAADAGALRAIVRVLGDRAGLAVLLAGVGPDLGLPVLD